MSYQCEICNEDFKSPAGLAAHEFWKHNPNPEETERVRKKISDKLKDLPPFTKEHRRKISEAVKKQWADPEQRKKKIDGLKGHSFSEEGRRKLSRIGKERAKDPEHRKFLSKIANDYWQKEENKKRQSETIKALWEDPVFEERMIRANNLWRRIKPNTLEIEFNKLLQKNFPNQFKYVGDGYTFIGRKNPDFIDFDGRLIIELFGDYWHKPEDEEKMINYYQEHGGWDTMIVWEHELDEQQKVIKTIGAFTGVMV